MAIPARLLKYRPKGAILIEVMIVAVMIAIITTACLNLFNIYRDIYLDSKGTYIAVNVLDSFMTISEKFPGSALPITPFTGYSFKELASSSNLYLFTYQRIPEGDRILGDLNQLKNWKIEWRWIHRWSSYGNTPYFDHCCIMRISWDGVRRDSSGNPIRKKEEIFSFFTAPERACLDRYN